jgi:hypothetical protein
MQQSLLCLLENIKAPLYAYGKIMSWAYNAVSQGHRFVPNFQDRKTVFNQMFMQYDMKGILPKTTNVMLVECQCVKVIHFDFQQMIHSLLLDETLMQEDNLVLHDNMAKCPPKSSIINEINDVNWYCKAHKHLCKEKTNFLGTLVLFINKTHTDMLGKLNLEPVMFMLSIFKRHVRCNPHAWQMLGYIMDLLVAAQKHHS